MSTLNLVREKQVKGVAGTQSTFYAKKPVQDNEDEGGDLSTGSQNTLLRGVKRFINVRGNDIVLIDSAKINEYLLIRPCTIWHGQASGCGGIGCESQTGAIRLNGKTNGVCGGPATHDLECWNLGGKKCYTSPAALHCCSK